MMPKMRTTLTIEDDLAEALKDLARERGVSFKSAVNEALRRGLSSGEKPPARAKRFRVVSARRGFRPGVDPYKLNQLSDELEAEHFARTSHERGSSEPE